MKDFAIAQAFTDAFSADATFTGVTVHNAQTAETKARPAVSFECSTTPLNSTGSILRYKLTAIVESKASADSDDHAALAGNVAEKLLGSGRAALLTALALTPGLDWRGISADAVNPDIHGDTFRTPIVVNGTVIVS